MLPSYYSVLDLLSAILLFISAEWVNVSTLQRSQKFPQWNKKAWAHSKDISADSPTMQRFTFSATTAVSEKDDDDQCLLKSKLFVHRKELERPFKNI